MKVPVFSIEGKKLKEIELPAQFSEAVRPDLIHRAFVAYQSNQRHAYGTDPMAGLRTSAKMKSLRRSYGSWMGKGIARLARIRVGSGHMTARVRRSPHATKGRHADPPRAWRVWQQKINKTERRKAIRAALSATAQKNLVEARGHIAKGIETLPIVVEDKVQETKKAKDIIALLTALGLKDELARAAEKKIRAGKGKTRGRPYRKKVGPLFVVAENKGILKAARNIAGIDAVLVNNLNANLLAPGARAGRLAIFTSEAIARLEKEKLFA